VQAAIQAAPASSTAEVHSPASLAAFDHALDSFISAHPDFQLLSLPNDLVVYDSHLARADATQANVATWTFADGSQVTLVGVMPHHAAALG